jgi:sulfur carrier protein ThiS adenylyltransferase
MMPDHPDRDIRQRGLVPPEALAACHTAVIGVGAIGRQLALQLAALGVPLLTLIDDTVSEENLAPQGYWPTDLGQAKVQATAHLCRQVNPDVQIKTYPERFRRSLAQGLVDDGSLIVFACVDSMNTRRTIWDSLRSYTDLFVDGRMHAEVIRVLASENLARADCYEESLFASEEAFAGACTARSTIYAASIAAGLMVGQFTRWLRRMELIQDQTLNLLAAELNVLHSALAL